MYRAGSNKRVRGDFLDCVLNTHLRGLAFLRRGYCNRPGRTDSERVHIRVSSV